MTNGTKVVSVHVYDYQQNDACVAVTMIAVLLTQATHWLPANQARRLRSRFDFCPNDRAEDYFVFILDNSSRP